VSPAVAGALLGGLAAAGLLLAIGSSPPLRPVRLEQRLSPYLRDTPRPSRLLAGEPGSSSTLVQAARRLLEPMLADGVRLLDRFAGGRGAVRRRLAALGSAQTIDDFRMEQVVWAAFGLGAGAVGGGLLAAAAGRFDPLSTVLLAAVGAVGGVLGRDWWLTVQVRRRQQRMLAEFPAVAELLALAVTAGEGAPSAIERVCRLTRGELTGELADVLARARVGVALVTALEGLRDRTGLDPLARFVDGVIVAIERGTPLAEVLRAQAADVREAGKRALLEAGGRREILMMVPVVFLILPVTVLFALFPGLLSITQLVN
jgi:tight adherence protein C